MRSLLVLALIVAPAVAIAEEPPPSPPGAAPLRIAIECQGYGRTKACPAFLLGFVEQNPLFLSSPRAEAQVVLYYNVNGVANDDRVFLRFVGELDGAPPVVETTVDLDTRSNDDAQRAQLEPAFTRGAALYVAALHPEAVQIALVPISGGAIVAPKTTPWGFEASFGGYSSCSGNRCRPWRKNQTGYTNVQGYGNIGASRVERTSSLSFGVSGSYGMNRSPHLILEDGTEVSFDTDQASVNAYLSGERHLNDHWALGASTSLFHEDPGGQYKLGWEASGGIEWDKYQADDPRGNKLAVSYQLGWSIDKYNVRNELGETFAQYPEHTLSAGGTVRKDKVGYGLYFVASGELLHPGRRHTLSMSPFIELQVGAHVDVNLSLSVTERAVPAPDVDRASYEQISRAAYAEPLSAFTSLNLRFHWDRTNGQRNDRFN